MAKNKPVGRPLVVCRHRLGKWVSSRWHYRFFFYAGDRDEPQHVHVERDERIAKFWPDPIRLQSSGGFSRVEIARIGKLVNNHRIELVEAWNEYFDR
jgi:hypothetical protein